LEATKAPDSKALDTAWRGWFVISTVVSLAEAMVLAVHLAHSETYQHMGGPLLFGALGVLCAVIAWFSAVVVRRLFQTTPWVRPVVAAACTVFIALLACSAVFAVAGFASRRAAAGDLGWRHVISVFTAFAGWTLAGGLAAALAATVVGLGVERGLRDGARRR
jgi:hypothetical protein